MEEVQCPFWSEKSEQSRSPGAPFKEMQLPLWDAYESGGLQAWLSSYWSFARRVGDGAALWDIALFSPLFTVKIVIWNHSQVTDTKEVGFCL